MSPCKFDRSPFDDALLWRQNDPEAVDSRVHRVGEIEILSDRLKKDSLLAIPEGLMVDSCSVENEIVSSHEVFLRPTAAW
jgi:hypothetical protein